MPVRLEPGNPHPLPSTSCSEAMPSSSYSVESITAQDEIVRLCEDWDRLSSVSSSPNVFATFDWFQTWYQHIVRTEGSARLQPNVLALKRNGAITGIAPLTRSVVQRFGFEMRRLQFAARNQEWDYNDLLVGDNRREQTAALCQFLSQTKSGWELVDLMDVRDVDGAVDELRGAVQDAGLACAVLPTEERCPYMTIDGSWEEMLSRRSSVTRHSFRNRQSRLNRTLGEGLQMRILDAPHTEPGLLERMIELEAQKRSGGKLSVPFLGKNADVFGAVFDKLGPKGWLCVTVMEWKDRLISWHLLFRCGGKLWGYLTAYDHEFARLSPGGLLIPAIIDYGFAHGCTEYDFLSGEESYKMQWATGFHERKRLLIWNDRWQSRLCAAAFRKLRVRTTASRAAGEPPDANSTAIRKE